ncbi:hypothetical protein V0R50_08535 [Pseudomonas sp. 148P]|uniref:Halovibrin HvnA n=1 Tax=Pseudomonas ulcerans TaxID=3115852 RepID=A0ABU7HNZ4_9PSED|nr:MULTISPECIES: hypothetical protein [unclassified Pseudomonas]MEE1920485.1 hypothetical protein [Pseudomonas sp. 147P]MEE1933267.1 hypothetical protein [Pseudomonas sp. 148P]
MIGRGDVAWTLLLLLSSVPSSNAAGYNYSSSLAELGAATVAELTRRYSDERENCGAEWLALHHCAGVLLRGTSTSTAYNTWEPNPATVAAGRGMTFSYLIRTASLPMTIGSKGYIAYPGQLAPGYKFQLNFLCAFPISGATGHRGAKGCGQHEHHDASGPCFEEQVFSAAQYRNKYLSAPASGPLQQRQCGFSLLHTSSNHSAYAFRQMLQLTREVPYSGSNDQNELLADNPAADVKSEQWPIEAFYYNKPDGLEGAQIDQRNYFDKSGIMLPIIRITLPVRGYSDAVFEYLPSDQARFQ